VPATWQVLIFCAFIGSAPHLWKLSRRKEDAGLHSVSQLPLHCGTFAPLTGARGPALLPP
jgi:hypothetical protein